MRYNNRTFIYFFISACLLLSGKAFGQGRGADTTVVITDTTNIDALFKKARELYYNEKVSQSRRICQKILEKKPGYYEVRTFLGRTYAWEKQYDNARTELSRVLIEKENDYEALNALFDVEFWTESYSLANDYLKVALGYYPTSEELMIKKAKLQIRLEEKSDAALTLRRVLDLNPGQKEAIKIMNSLEGRKLNNNFQTSYLVDLFDKKTPQQLCSAELGRNFSFGSLTIRGNLADKFNTKGLQYEIESYLHFTKSTYANLLAGYSNVSIFPKEKYTFELYQKLPAGFELSLGMRYLKFSKETTIYTASLSKYYKDYWFSIRTFVTPKTDSIIRKANLNNSSVTIIANIRHYFGDSDNYFGIKAGRGTSPDENRTYNVAIPSDHITVVSYLPGYQAGIELQKRAFGRWLIKFDFTYAKESVQDKRFTQRLSTTVTLKTVF